VVLDPTDGDFSVTINGNEHWWIQDEAVIIIADYIEKQLKTQEDEKNN
jgi:D-tyrosyl-tRNA(Tyr) deacylase